MYKNPIFGDNIPLKNHQITPRYNIFPKFVKILQICKHSPTIFSKKKFAPILPVATVQWKITGG